jgi:outer membrane beta-barrel protein
MMKWFVLAVMMVLGTSKKIHAGEQSLYDFLWLDPDKKVYVLQNKIYKKEHSFYADVGYMGNFTSKFQDTNGFQLKTGFWFREEWAIEATYQQYFNSNNNELTTIRHVSKVEPFIRRLNSSYGANIIWSPFYGKINTFNQIFYFDWYFGAGITRINAESNGKTVGLTNVVPRYEKETYTGGVFKTGVKLHLKENIHLGIEYMNTYYNAPGPTQVKKNKLRTNTDVILSIGYSF